MNGFLGLQGDWSVPANSFMLVLLSLVNVWQSKRIEENKRDLQEISKKVHETRPYRKTDNVPTIQERDSDGI